MTLIDFEGKSPQIDPTAFVAPGAQLIGDIQLGPESSIWYNCVLRGDADPNRAVLSEYHVEKVRAPCFMARRDRWKYVLVHEHGEQLFDLEADPGEWTNLAGERPDLRYHLGMALASSGQKERAIRELEQATAPEVVAYYGIEEARARLEELKRELPPQPSTAAGTNG